MYCFIESHRSITVLTVLLITPCIVFIYQMSYSLDANENDVIQILIHISKPYSATVEPLEVGPLEVGSGGPG